MEKQQINAAVEAYQKTKDQTIITDLYRRLTPIFERRVRRETRFSGLDADDVRWAIDYAMTKAIEKFDAVRGDFINLFYTILRNEINRLKKDCYRNILRETIPLDDVLYDDDAPLEVYDRTEETVEEKVIRKIQRKIEQWQLLESMEIPDIVRKLLKMEDDSVFESKTSLGKALGFKHAHQQAERLLERIRKTYDIERFGDPADYFIA